MAVIDADTHVDENEETWQYMDEADRQFMPVTVVHQTSIPGQQAPGYNRYWLIDGQLRVRRVRDDVRTGTVQATRELLDVPARLRHMDELGIDTQVLYPTLFLSQVSGKPEVEAALCKSYNRWIADKTAESHGRLRWVAVLPTMTMDKTIEEVRFAKEHGACGVMKKGVECGGRLAGDAYFYPLYEEAGDLDLAICIHLGSGDPFMSDSSRAAAGMYSTVLPVVDACNNLVWNGIPGRFPKLRVGFIEAGAGWVPYVLSDLWARHERMTWAQNFDFKQDLFRECRFFVAYQTQEDLSYLLTHGTEDSLVIGTDYSHADMSAEITALAKMRERADKGEISAVAVKKMLEDNPAALYGL